MTPQERELLEGLFSRVRAAASGQRDAEADAFITEQVRQSPHAPYLLTQTVIVQEEALKAAAARLDELNARVAELEQEAERGRQDTQSSFLGGIGKSLFGGGEAQSSAPPRPASRGSVPSAGSAQGYSVGAAPESPASTRGGIGMPNVPPPGGRWTQQGQPIGQGAGADGQQQGGGSFLKGALGAAAGVAGGMLARQFTERALQGLQSARHRRRQGRRKDAGRAPTRALQRRPASSSSHGDRPPSRTRAARRTRGSAPTRAGTPKRIRARIWVTPAAGSKTSETKMAAPACRSGLPAYGQPSCRLTLQARRPSGRPFRFRSRRRAFPRARAGRGRSRRRSSCGCSPTRRSGRWFTARSCRGSGRATSRDTARGRRAGSPARPS